MAIENNGMIYTFSEEEVAAVGELLRWAREYKGDDASETIKTVASAFNRPFFNKEFINND